MQTKYTPLFSAVHWIHAIMITLIIGGALLTLPALPTNGIDLAPFRAHMIFGFVVTLVTFARIYLVRKQPELEPLKISALRQAIVTWNHRLIYVFLVVVGLSGMATTKSAHIGQVLIFGKDPSVYTGPDGITATLASIHSYAAYGLIALILMHITGTVAYALKTKENVFARVGLGRNGSKNS
jgi:cytochrome b561